MRAGRLPADEGRHGRQGIDRWSGYRDHKICTVVGEASPDGVDIVGIGTSPSTGLRKGVVVNIEQTVQSIKKALEEAELMAECEIRAVYAGMPANTLRSSTVMA